MSIKERKKEAEAVLDSAEMTLETFGETGKAARDLKQKVSQLETELQDPDSEKSLEKLIEEVRELMEEVEQGAGNDMMMEDPGMEGPGAGGPPSGGMPDDDMPPI